MLFKIYKWGNKNIKKINHFSTSKRVSDYDCNANSMAWMTEFNAHLIWSYLNKLLAPGLKDRLHAHCPSTLPLNYISHHNILHSNHYLLPCLLYCVLQIFSFISLFFTSNFYRKYCINPVSATRNIHIYLETYCFVNTSSSAFASAIILLNPNYFMYLQCGSMCLASSLPLT